MAVAVALALLVRVKCMSMAARTPLALAASSPCPQSTSPSWALCLQHQGDATVTTYVADRESLIKYATHNSEGMQVNKTVDKDSLSLSSLKLCHQIQQRTQPRPATDRGQGDLVCHHRGERIYHRRLYHSLRRGLDRERGGWHVSFLGTKVFRWA